jgi:hypothetical protein
LFIVFRGRKSGSEVGNGVRQCQNNASRMMIGMGTPSSHSRMERIKTSLDVFVA